MSLGLVAYRERVSHRPHGSNNPGKMLLCICHGAGRTASFVFINTATPDIDVHVFVMILQAAIKSTVDPD